MAATSSHRPIVSKIPFGEPLFHATPASVSFDDYEGYQQYTATIALRNKDSVARRVRLDIQSSPDTEFFTLSAPRMRGTYSNPISPEAAQMGETSSASKIAPGMECVYTLTFNPHQRRRYAIDLVCITERETFCIPVRAAGVLPKVDIPAAISFGDAPVNYPTVRPFLLSNTGTIDTRFSLTASKGFTCQPSDGVLPVGQVTQILCTFNPLTLGAYDGVIECALEDDVVVTAAVRGHATNVDVSFTAPVLKVPPTYIKLTSHASTRLSNNNDIPIKFAFKQHPSAAAELASKAAALQQLDEAESAELHQLSLLRPAVIEAVKSLIVAERKKAGGRGVQHSLRPRRERPAIVSSGVNDSFQLNDGVPSKNTYITSSAKSHSRRRRPRTNAHDDDEDDEHSGVGSADANDLARMHESDSSVDEHSGTDATDTEHEHGDNADVSTQQGGRFVGYEFDSFDGHIDTDAALHGDDDTPSEDVLMEYDEYTEHLRTLQEVRRRYAQLRETIDTTGAFAHPTFTLDPPEGEIYPHGALDICARFKPAQSLEYSVIAYCEVSGVEQRIPLRLVAQGVGPKAVFSFESLDVGDVFIHAVYHYKATLRNVGDITAHYSLVPESTKRLKFTPAQGTLAVSTARSSHNKLLGILDSEPDSTGANDAGAGGVNPTADGQAHTGGELVPSASQGRLSADSVKIDIQLTAHQIGEFVEHVQWRLHGSTEPVILTFKGRVVGPTFHMDQPSLDFGTVCYGFLNTRVITLYNTSQVPLKYRLRIPQDHVHDDGSKEFAISPATAVVLPKSKQQITVSLVSRSVGLYHASAALPVNGPMTLSALRAANAAAGVTVVPQPPASAAFEGDAMGLAGGHLAVAAPTLRSSAMMIAGEAYKLVVDVLGVGDAVQSVPIKGQGMVFYPTVMVDKLNFGNVFMRLPTTMTLPLTNVHDLDAKIEVVPQDDNFRQIAEITPEFASLAVQPNSSAELAISLKAQRLGPFSFPMYLRIPGSDVPPVHVLVTGNAVGPSVIASKSTLSFGSIEVLTPVTQTVVLTNTSPIPAHYKAILQKPSSVYSVDTPVGTIPPKSSLTLTVTATLNENLAMPDTLIVLIDENTELTIQLRSKGVGTTMEPDVGIEKINHGDVLTHTETTRTFRLVNRGRRPQTLYWMKIPTHDELDLAEQNMLLATGAATKKDLAAKAAAEKEAKARAMVDAVEADAAAIGANPDDADNDNDDDVFFPELSLAVPGADAGAATAAGADGDDTTDTEADPTARMRERQDSRREQRTHRTPGHGSKLALDKASFKRLKQLAEYVPSTFKVTPAKITLLPDMAMDFTVTGISPEAGAIKELWLCRALIGKNKDLEDIHKCRIRCNFVEPTVDFGVADVKFVAQMNPGEQDAVYPEPVELTLRNPTPLPLQMTMHAPFPFSTGVTPFMLQPGATERVVVAFDHSHKSDRLSAIVQAYLTATFANHPAAVKLPLVGQFCFPNVTFDQNVVDFGCILNDTNKRNVLTVTNSSVIPVHYEWVMLEEPVANANNNCTLEDISGSNALPLPPRGASARPGSAAFPSAREALASASGSRYDASKAGVAADAVIPFGVTSTANGAVTALPASDVFSIAPLRGVLAPGQTQGVEFTFFGQQNVRAKVIAVCRVLGGPEYELGLLAESSQVSFKLDRPAVHFGARDIDTVSHSEFVLHNPGRVPLDFTIDTTTLSALVAPCLTFSTLAGQLKAGEKAKIGVAYKSQLPMDVREHITVQLGFYEPIIVPITALGTFPHIVADLPRVAGGAFDAVLPEAERLSAARVAAREALEAALDARQQAAHEQMVLANGYHADVAVAVGGGNAVRRLSAASESRLATARPGTGTTAMSPRLGSATSRGLPIVYSGASGERAVTSAVGVPVPTVLTVAAEYPVPDLPAACVAAVPAVFAHIEADRLVFLEHMKTVLGAAIEKDAANNAHHAATGAAEARLPATVTSAGLVAKANRAGTSTPAQQFAVANYVMDFSHLVLGMSKTRTFTVTNTSTAPISWDVSKDLLQRTVFSLEPTSVVRLPPGESQVVTVVCQASAQPKKGQPFAALLRDEDLVVPIVLRGGPRINVTLRVNITVPNLALSSKFIDFGKVYIGFRKEITVQLTNDREVPCEWGVRQLAGLTQKERLLFDILPAAGTLLPGARQNITIAFTPEATSDFLAQLPIRMVDNPNPALIKIKAEGVPMVLAVTPETQTLPAIQPFQCAAPVPVTVSNDSDYPVEIYSVETDRAYLEEEQILAQDEGYVADVLRVFPPRIPGDQLPLPVLQRFHAKLRAARATMLLNRERETAVQAAVAAAALNATATNTVLTPEQLTEIAEAASDEFPDKPTVPDAPVNVVVVGSPFSGQSTLVKALAADSALGLQQSVVTLDAAVAFYYKLDLQVEARAKNAELRERERQKRQQANAKKGGRGVSGIGAVQSVSSTGAPGSGAQSGRRNSQTANDDGAGSGERVSKADKAHMAEEIRWQEEDAADAAFYAELTAEDLAMAAEVRATITNFRTAEQEAADAANSGASRRGAGAGNKRAAGANTATTTVTALSNDVTTALMSDDSEENSVTDFTDLRDKTVLSEEQLSRAFSVFLLHKGGAFFQRGIIIDGVDSVFCDRLTAARALKKAFSNTALLRENATHVITLAVTHEEARRRALNLYYECKNIVEDKELLNQLKRFKEIPEREIAKLADDKREKYEDMLVLANQRRKAEVLLRRLASVDYDRLHKYYGDAIGDIDEIRGGAVDAAAMTGTATSPANALLRTKQQTQVLKPAPPAGLSPLLAVAAAASAAASGSAAGSSVGAAATTPAAAALRRAGRGAAVPAALTPAAVPEHVELTHLPLSHLPALATSSAAESVPSANAGIIAIVEVFGADATAIALPEPLSPRIVPAPSIPSPIATEAAAAEAAAAAAKEDLRNRRQAAGRQSRGRTAMDSLARMAKSMASEPEPTATIAAIPEAAAVPDAAEFALEPRDWTLQDTAVPIVKHSWIRARWFDGSTPTVELVARATEFVQAGFEPRDEHAGDVTYIPPPRVIQLVRRPVPRQPPAFAADKFVFVYPLPPAAAPDAATAAAGDAHGNAHESAPGSPTTAPEGASGAAAPAPLAAPPAAPSLSASPSRSSGLLARARAARENAAGGKGGHGSTTSGGNGDASGAEEKEPEPLTLSTLYPGLVPAGSTTTSPSVPRMAPLGVTRWVVPARSVQVLHVQFTAHTTGEFAQNFSFEQCYRAGQPVTTELIGTSMVPSISRAPKNVFDLARLAKASGIVGKSARVVGVPVSTVDPALLDTAGGAGSGSNGATGTVSATVNGLSACPAGSTIAVLAPASPPVKQYLFADNVFDFGSLLVGKHHSMLTAEAEATQLVEDNERMYLRERDEQAMNIAAQALTAQYTQAYYALIGAVNPQGGAASRSGARATGGVMNSALLKQTPAAAAPLGSPLGAKGKRVGGRGSMTDPLLAAGSVTLSSTVPAGFGPAPDAVVLSQVIAQAVAALGVPQGNNSQSQSALAALPHKLALAALQHIAQIPLSYSDPLGFRLPNHYPSVLGKAFGAILKDIAAPKAAAEAAAKQARRNYIPRAPPGTTNKVSVSPRSSSTASLASQTGVLTAVSTPMTDIAASTSSLVAHNASATTAVGAPVHWTVRRSAGVRSLNSEVFRITNMSPFPLIVRCGFRYRVNSLGQRNVTMALMAQDALENTRGGARAGSSHKKLSGGNSSAGAANTNNSKGGNGRATTPTASLAQLLAAPAAAPAATTSSGPMSSRPQMGLKQQTPLAAALAMHAASGVDNTELVCYASKRSGPRMRLAAIDVTAKPSSVTRPSSLSSGDSAGGSGLAAGTSPLLSVRNRVERERQGRDQRERGGDGDKAGAQPRRQDRQAEEEAKIEAWKTEDVFTCEPGLITVPVGGVEEVTVWSFPQAPGVFYDELVCTVADNPEAFVFPVRCEGVEPRLTVSTSDINFEGLLLGQAAAVTVTLHNPTSIPVGWSLRQWELMLASHAFNIQPATSGVIAPGATAQFTVEFKAFEEVAYDFRLELDVRDAERARAVVDTHVIGVRGHGYKLNALLGMAPNGLDFRTVRTGDEAVQHLSVTNQGKNPIKFFVATAPNANGSPSPLESVLTAVPAQGLLAVGQTAVVALTARSEHEMTVVNAHNLTVLIQDGCQPAPEGSAPGLVFPTPDNVSPSGLPLAVAAPPLSLPVPISLKVINSKLRVLPFSGLTFGPTEVNTSRVTKFKVLNDGVFPFQLHIFPQDPSHPFSRAAIAARAAAEAQAAEAARVEALSSSTQLGGRRIGGAGANPSSPSDGKRSALAGLGAVARDTKPVAKPSRGGPAGRRAGSDRNGGGAGDMMQVPDVLTVGMYTVTPTSGIVEPGSLMEVSVTLKSNDCGSFIELLNLIVIDHHAAAPAAGPGAAAQAAAAAAATPLASSVSLATALPAQSTVLKYELCGETCSQGLEVRAFPSIFEETEIITHGEDLDAYTKADGGEARDVFVLDQKTLVFAPVVVGQVPAPVTPADSESSSLSDAAAAGSRSAAAQAQPSTPVAGAPVAGAGDKGSAPGSSPGSSTRRTTSRSRASLVAKDKPALANALSVGATDKDAAGAAAASSKKAFVWASRTQRVKLINPFKVQCAVSVRTWQPAQWAAYQQQQQVIALYTAQIAAQEKAAAAAAAESAAAAASPTTPGRDAVRGSTPSSGAAATPGANNGTNAAAGAAGAGSKAAGSTSSTPAVERRSIAPPARENKRPAGANAKDANNAIGNAPVLLAQAQAAAAALAAQATTASLSDAAAGAAVNAFTVSTTSVTVPAHEHRYIDVTFTPTAFDSYTCVFEALVEKSSDPVARQLVFELRGDGTLPNLTVLTPTAREPETAAPLLVFPRVFTGPASSDSGATPARVASSADMQKLPLVLRNDGAVTATLRFEMVGVSSAAASSALDSPPPQASRGRSASITAASLAAAAAAAAAAPQSGSGEVVAPALLMSPTAPLLPPAASRGAFWFDGLGSVIKIAPGETREFSVAFLPSKAGLHICELRMIVADNQFESPRIFLRGEGYTDDVTVDGLSTVRLEAKAKPAFTAGGDKAIGDATTSNARSGASASADTSRTQSSRGNKSSQGGSGSAAAAAAAAAQTATQLAKDLRSLLGEGAEVRDELVFGDVFIGDALSKTFTLRNHSEHVYRFKWNPLPALDDASNDAEQPATNARASMTLSSASLAGALNATAAAPAAAGASATPNSTARRRGPGASAAEAAAKEQAAAQSSATAVVAADWSISPAIGHLPPFATKTITVTFTGTDKRTFPSQANLALKCALQRIAYVPPAVAAERAASTAAAAAAAAATASPSSASGAAGLSARRMQQRPGAAPAPAAAVATVVVKPADLPPQWWEPYYDAGAPIEWDSSMTSTRVVPYDAFVAATEVRAEPVAQTAPRKLGATASLAAAAAAAPAAPAVNPAFAALRISQQAVAQGAPDAQRRIMIVEPLTEPVYDLVLEPVAAPAEAAAPASLASPVAASSLASARKGPAAAGAGAASAAAPAPSTGGRRNAAPVPTAPQPLPEVRVSVPVSVMCDTPRYELDTPIVDRVSFADTLMYQSRTWTFTMRNVSAVALHYDWRATPVMPDAPRPQAARPTSAHHARVLQEAFTISPAVGSIAVDDAQVFTVTFAPLDSETFATLLDAHIAGLSHAAAAAAAAGNGMLTLPSIHQTSLERQQEAQAAAAAAATAAVAVPAGQAPPRFVVSGLALRPKCHVDLVSSDYLSAHRRAPALVAMGAPLDPLTRVIEIASLGTHTKNTRRFCVINPTDRAYAFHWTCEDAMLGTPLPLQSPFACVYGSGVVQSGRKFEMVFDYTPTEDVVSESLWRFAVPELGLSVPVLLVGTVRDPRVRLDKARVDFKSIILNRAAQETVFIINQESVPFNFNVDKASLAAFASAAAVYAKPGTAAAAAVQPAIAVEPMQGTVPANGRFALTVKFRPNVEAAHNITLAVNVVRKSSALTLNVKGQGMAIKTALLLRDPSIAAPGAAIANAADAAAAAAAGAPTGAVIAELVPSTAAGTISANANATTTAVANGVRTQNGAAATVAIGGQQINVVELGTVTVNDKARRVFELRNMGNVALDFVWSFPSEAPPVASTTVLAGSNAGAGHQSRSALLAMLNKESRRTKDAAAAAAAAASARADGAGCPVPGITLSPMTGTVKRGGSVTCEISFCSDVPVVVDKLLANLVVAKTVRYSVEIAARAERTRLKLSAASHDFGLHFIPPPVVINPSSSAAAAAAAALPYLEDASSTTVISLTNAEKDKNVQVEALVDALFKTQATVQGPRTALGVQTQNVVLKDQVFHLDDGFSSAILVPGESRGMRVSFRPPRAGKFSVTLPLEVNGLSKVPVTLTGEAVPLRLEAQLAPETPATIDGDNSVSADPAAAAQSWVSFGQLRPGDCKTVTVPLVNKSRKAVTFRLHSRTRGVQSQLIDQAFSLKSVRTPPPPPTSVISSAVTPKPSPYARPPPEFAADAVITLEPKASLTVTAALAPHCRLPAFVRDIFFEVVDASTTAAADSSAADGDSAVAEPRLFYLFSTKGACVDTGLALDTDRLAFGPVVVGASRTLRAHVTNVGDVACTFAFDTSVLGTHFALSPAEGLVAPQQTVAVDIVFTPQSSRAAANAVMDPTDVTVPRVALLKDGVAQDAGLRLVGTVVDVSPTALAKIAIANATAAATARPGSSGAGNQLALTGALGAIAGAASGTSAAAAAVAASAAAAAAAAGEGAGSLPPGVVLSTLSFTSRARVPVTQTIPITNDSTQPLVPTFSSPLFSGPSRIVINPKETVQYPVTYLPLARTATQAEIADKAAAAAAASAGADAAANGGTAAAAGAQKGKNARTGPVASTGAKPAAAAPAAKPMVATPVVSAGGASAAASVDRPAVHEASLFIPLPQGGALCYALQGTAPQPAPVVAVTSLAVPCKQAVQHVFPVANWLSEYQSFKVLIDVSVPRGALPVAAGSPSALPASSSGSSGSERPSRAFNSKLAERRERTTLDRSASNNTTIVAGSGAGSNGSSSSASAGDGSNLCAACGSDTPQQCGCPAPLAGQVAAAPPSAVTASVVPVQRAGPAATADNFVDSDMMRAPRRGALTEGGGWASGHATDGTFTAYGASTIDVPPRLERSYKLNLFALVPSAVAGVASARVRVRFLNEKTQEYADYVFLVAPSTPTLCAGVDASAVSTTAGPITAPASAWAAPELPLLATDVRQTKTLRLAFANPLPDRAVTLTKLTCSNPAVFAANAANVGAPVFPLTVPANGTVTVPVCFRPLMPIAPAGSAKVLLTLSTDTMGDFTYTLPLQCPKNADKDVDLSAWSVGAAGVVPPEMLARADAMLRFEAPLGESVVKSHVFKSPCTVATTYDVSILPVCSGKVTAAASEAAAAFTVFDPAAPTVALTKISVPAAETSMSGAPVSVNLPVSVRFEPSVVGDASAIVILNSPQGGVFMCALNATGAGPKPQGPISLTPVATLAAQAGAAGGSSNNAAQQAAQQLLALALPPTATAFTSIKFKNVFNATHTFSFALDGSTGGTQAFVMSKRAEKLPAKGESVIAVGFTGPIASAAAAAAAAAASASTPAAAGAEKQRLSGAAVLTASAKLTVTCMETQHVWTFFLQVPRI